MGHNSLGSHGATRTCPGTVANSGSERLGATDLSVNPHRLQVGKMSRFFNPSGLRTASCTLSPINLAGGTSTVGAAEISSRCTKWRRSSEGRSGYSVCPPTHLNQPIASFVPIPRRVSGIWAFSIPLQECSNRLRRHTQKSRFSVAVPDTLFSLLALRLHRNP